MNRRSWLMLRVLINRYNSKAGNALLKFLPQEELQEVMEQDIRSTDLNPILQLPQKALSKVHYSWIKPLMNHFPDRLHPTVMAALTAEQIAGLRSSIPISISPFVKAFVLNKLYYLLKIDDRLPIEYLPLTEISPLAKWPKRQMINLIDFLGIHDLASEVKHIVNREYLNNIYTSLTPKQVQFLKMCLHQKERLTAPRLGIDLNNIDTDKLKQILHRRGLIRLGKAFCGQHLDLVWYITHILDKGRGTLLLQEYKPEEIPNITPILKQQVINLMNFLKSE